MNYNHISVLIKKDLKDIMSDKSTIVSLFSIPLIISVVLPIFVILAGKNQKILQNINGINIFIQNLSKLTFAAGKMPQNEQVVYLILMYFFLPFFLLIPITIATIIASSSFVGEKEKDTIEGLLYTPLTNKELILGKILATLIPTVIIADISIIIYGFITDFFGLVIMQRIFFPNITWILVALFLNPLLSFLAIELVIAISQRANSARSAQSLSMVLILPIIGLIASQASGVLMLGNTFIIVLSLLITIIVFAIFQLVVKKFKREQYLLKGK